MGKHIFPINPQTKYIKNSHDCTQGRHTEGPETYEKMLSITSHQRDANENHNEIPLHTGHNGHHKQINKQQVLARLWRKGNPSILLVGMQSLWKTVWNVLRRLKMELPFDLEFHCWDDTLRSVKHQFKRTYTSQCS